MSHKFAALSWRVMVSALTMCGARVAVAADSADSVTLQEVVVTAEKRTENVKDVPFTVNVLNADTIANDRVTSFEDVKQLTPGLEFGSAFGGVSSFLAIRGVSPQTFGDPTVVVFTDGYSIGNSTNINSADLFDLERIEVLKGPQASLYGANALDGTINLITQKPSFTDEEHLEASYGNYDTSTVQASLSGPIIADTLAFRVAGSYWNQQGYWGNLFTDQSHWGGGDDQGYRVALRATPADWLESNLSFSYGQTSRDAGDPVNPLVGFSFENLAALGTLNVNSRPARGGGQIGRPALQWERPRWLRRHPSGFR